MANLELGDSLPTFHLPGIDGRRWNERDVRGEAATAVMWWCNHCPYVQAWESRAVDIQRDYGPRGVRLVAINSNNAEKYPLDSFAGMVERAAQKGFNFAYLHDESQTVAKAFGAERTPEVFLFDKDGLLRFHGAIDDNFEDPSSVQQHWLRDALDALLSGRPVANARTPLRGCTVKWK